ncbi:hypothetical protein EVAR_92133_1 [Eumeta japonica]|uniref:Uncharacterized protein n=1 Tax=Eumeta variegata TaxID=151549 RepID=A0A4C1SZ93_EUMVA|nr:hypothetical protein EVAR_92133_1 [Eumeta japonica]
MKPEGSDDRAGRLTLELHNETTYLSHVWACWSSLGMHIDYAGSWKGKIRRIAIVPNEKTLWRRNAMRRVCRHETAGKVNAEDGAVGRGGGDTACVEQRTRKWFTSCASSRRCRCSDNCYIIGVIHRLPARP